MIRRILATSVLVCALFGLLILGSPAWAAPATPWPDPEGDEYARYLSTIGRGLLSQPRQVWLYRPADGYSARRVVVAQDASLYLLYEREVPGETDVRRICVDKLAKDGTKLWTVELGSGKRTNRTTAGDIALLSDGGVVVIWRCDDPSSSNDNPRIRRLRPDGSTAWGPNALAGYQDGGTQLDLVFSSGSLYAWSGNGYVYPEAYLYRVNIDNGASIWSLFVRYNLRQMLASPDGSVLLIAQDTNGNVRFGRVSDYPPDDGTWRWSYEGSYRRAMVGSEGGYMREGPTTAPFWCTTGAGRA